MSSLEKIIQEVKEVGEESKFIMTLTLIRKTVDVCEISFRINVYT